MRCATHRMQQRGAAAVEFALVLPLLMLIVLGTIDWGYYFFVREVVVNASREGARTGTLYPVGTSQAEAKTAAENYVERGALDRAKAAVTTGAGATDSIWVQVSYPVGSVTGFLTTVMPADVVARAEMRR